MASSLFILRAWGWNRTEMNAWQMVHESRQTKQKQKTKHVAHVYGSTLKYVRIFGTFCTGKWLPSVLWRCWLGGRKGIRPVKNWVVGCWRGYLSGARCRLAYAQLMPLPLTVSCFSKIQTGFTFLVPAHPGVPEKRAVKRVCVCVCVHVCLYWQVSKTLHFLQHVNRITPFHVKLNTFQITDIL